MSLSLKKEIFTFCKAQGSAVFATGCDYAMRLFIDKVLDHNYLMATFFGALTGGMVNCIVNYNFAFRGNTARKIDVVLRYFLMWAGSIALNTAGTAFFKEIVGLRVYTAMLLTSFLVALFWNYMLQRSFVYHDFRHIDGDNAESEGD
ncbi:MAG: GtrA family protein [Prevotella sp.]|nr:GtrA family protein [Prevotella sp.]